MYYPYLYRLESDNFKMGSIYTQMLLKALAAGAPRGSLSSRRERSAFDVCQSDTPRGRGTNSHLRPGRHKPSVRHWLRRSSGPSWRSL